MNDHHLGTLFTVLAGVTSAVMAYFDEHAAGIGAMVAVAALVINTIVNIYYKRKGQ